MNPDIEKFERLARDVFKTIPRELSLHVSDVVIRIAELPDPEIEHEMELHSPYDLLGLYQGISLDLKSVGHAAQDVDMIFLYRQPILKYCADTGEDSHDVVHHVLIHEIGHHFGFSDADMDRIERQDG